MSPRRSIGPSPRIHAAVRAWLSLGIVAFGWGLSGCGRAPSPAVVEVTTPTPAPLEPQYYQPPERLPAVTGNGKSTRSAKANGEAKANEAKANEAKANEAKANEAKANAGPDVP
jgi:hypothetical protein